MYLNHQPYTNEYRWSGGRGYPSYTRWASERRCERDGWTLLAECSDNIGYHVCLWQRGKMLALTVSYWRGNHDASKEGYTEDVYCQATTLDTLWERAGRKGVTVECRDDVTGALEADESPLLA